MSSSADIARLVASLIDANLPALDERRAAALLNFAMRILGSHMPAPPGGSQPMEVARRRDSTIMAMACQRWHLQEERLLLRAHTPPRCSRRPPPPSEWASSYQMGLPR